MRSLSLVFAASVVALGAPATASAQTPDGQTPAVETVCDPLVDATPGLYGLCVAYCEAQDCNEEMAQSGQCKAANPKILDNYNKKMQPGDPPMPCVAEPCPCFDAAFLEREIVDRANCRDAIEDRFEAASVAGFDLGREPVGCFALAVSNAFFDADGSFRSAICIGNSDDYDASTNRCISTQRSVQPMTLSEHSSCQSLIREHAERLELLCRTE